MGTIKHEIGNTIIELEWYPPIEGQHNGLVGVYIASGQESQFSENMTRQEFEEWCRWWGRLAPSDLNMTTPADET